MPVGGSVADMLRSIGLDTAVPARVFLDDRMLIPKERAHVYPKPGQIVAVRVVPAGGGSGKDTEIMLIALAAVTAVVTYGAGGFVAASLAAPGAAAAAGPTLAGAAGAFVSGALSETLKFAGTQLTNALIPPPATPAVRLSSTPQSYTVSGGANSAAAFSVIPKIYGARRIFPQYAASPYTELVGHDQYLRMLFLLGYGPLDISQILIGDTAIEDYEDVEWELRAGFTDDAPSRLYPGSLAETDIDIQLSKSNVGSAPTVYGWSVTQTSGPLADELSVDISFPGGLVAFSSLTGSPIHIQCTWQIQRSPSQRLVQGPRPRRNGGYGGFSMKTPVAPTHAPSFDARSSAREIAPTRSRPHSRHWGRSSVPAFSQPVGRLPAPQHRGLKSIERPAATYASQMRWSSIAPCNARSRSASTTACEDGAQPAIPTNAMNAISTHV
ncbi:MAG TPA: hypothetical protein VMV27_14420 [Candidatus Binataceae bacterium]|nr:hypothetical protein [Candidatus Binataceae bacterium]